MDLTAYIKFLLAFIFVIAVIGLIALIINKIKSGSSIATAFKRKKRLGVSEVHTIDQKRKLLLVKRDEIEHLILIDDTHSLVIENNIGLETPKPKGLDDILIKPDQAQETVKKTPSIREENKKSFFDERNDQVIDKPIHTKKTIAEKKTPPKKVKKDPHEDEIKIKKSDVEKNKKISNEKVDILSDSIQGK